MQSTAKLLYFIIRVSIMNLSKQRNLWSGKYLSGKDSISTEALLDQDHALLKIQKKSLSTQRREACGDVEVKRKGQAQLKDIRLIFASTTEAKIFKKLSWRRSPLLCCKRWSNRPVSNRILPPLPKKPDCSRRSIPARGRRQNAALIDHYKALDTMNRDRCGNSQKPQPELNWWDPVAFHYQY